MGLPWAIRRKVWFLSSLLEIFICHTCEKWGHHHHLLFREWDCPSGPPGPHGDETDFVFFPPTAEEMAAQGTEGVVASFWGVMGPHPLAFPQPVCTHTQKEHRLYWIQRGVFEALRDLQSKVLGEVRAFRRREWREGGRLGVCQPGCFEAGCS